MALIPESSHGGILESILEDIFRDGTRSLLADVDRAFQPTVDEELELILERRVLERMERPRESWLDGVRRARNPSWIDGTFRKQLWCSGP